MLGTEALGLLAVAIALALIELPLHFITSGPDGVIADYADEFLGGVAGQAITMPFLVAVTVLIYFELRSRIEGIEPEHVARAVDLASPEPQPEAGAALMRKAKRLVTKSRFGGTLAILFTDLENSTNYTHRLGDAAARQLLREHDRIIRSAVTRNDGREVKHLGDGIMAAFPAAGSAVAAATEIQRELARRNERDLEYPLNVRVGINAGEPVEEDGDLFGTAVQIAARLVREARPGAILVSEVVRQLALGRGYSFIRRGPVALRGFDEPFTVYEVDWEIEPVTSVT